VLSERKKKMRVLSLVLISFILDLIVVLPLGPLDTIVEGIQVFYWGWLFAFILPSAAIAGTLRWKPGSEILIGFVLFLSILLLIFAGFWFILFFISQLGP